MLEKIKKIVLYALLFYGFLGFIVLPFVLKPQVIEIVQNETNSKIAIDDISFNPFLFKLKLNTMSENNNSYCTSEHFQHTREDRLLKNEPSPMSYQKCSVKKRMKIKNTNQSWVLLAQLTAYRQEFTTEGIQE